MLTPWKGHRTRSPEFSLGDSTSFLFLICKMGDNTYLYPPYSYRLVMTRLFRDSEIRVKAFHERQNHTGVRD